MIKLLSEDELMQTIKPFCRTDKAAKNLFNIIRSQKIAHADMCIGKDHSKKTYDDMADSTANMETSDIIEASMEMAAMAREDLLRNQQRQRNK